MIQDMVLNLLGFMPLGFLLCATVIRSGKAFERRYWWIAFGLAFIFSLSLEIAQAWIPSRDSSLLDLMLNTLGAAAGGWLFSVFCVRGRASPDFFCPFDIAISILQKIAHSMSIIMHRF